MVLSRIRTEPTADSHCHVSVESVLRLRPLLKKEREDSIVLEPVKNVIRNTPAIVVLNPLHASLASPVSGSSLRSRSESESNTPTEYHFNHVLPENTSQDKIYYTLGLPIATAAMTSLKTATTSNSSNHKNPKNHLLISMGVANSGKTYTCFGGSSIPKRRASQDGLVPRLVDSLFSQSKHHASSGSKGFAVNISVVQVAHCKGTDPHACQIQDLLGEPSSSNSNKPGKSTTPKRGVRSMAARFERALPSPIRSPLKSAEFSELDADDLKPIVESCSDVTQAREVLQKGLSTSTKAAKGQNHHLLITLQPVFDSTQFGDKIAILDMAGLERGKRSQSRGKDIVANKIQAASAAVLHCLRTMTHNTNIRSGKADPIDIIEYDDMASEISCVSQEKDHMQRQLKPVPFRQHKVTMLLQPLFTSKVSTEVKLLLAAYPGHVDYYEKRILLQDMELLCGAALMCSKNATAATGLDRTDSRSVLSTDSRSTITRTTTADSDESSVDQDPVRIHRGLPANRRLASREPTDNSLSLSASIDEGDVKVSYPPAYAPSYSKASTISTSRVRPTAPAAAPPEPIAPPLLESKTKLNSPMNPNFVSDFPGVELSSKSKRSDPILERQRATTTEPSSMVGGRKAWAPPSTDDDKPQNACSGTIRPKRSVQDARDTRAPLGRSSLENGRSSLGSTGSTDKKEATRIKMRMLENSHRSPRESQASHSHRDEFAPKQRELPTAVNRSRAYEQIKQEVPTPIATDSSTDRRYEANKRRQSPDPEERVTKLEAQVKDLARQKRVLEQKCDGLEKEKRELKSSVQNSGRRNPQSKWTNDDEREFQTARQHRLEDQTLVKAPLRNHMDRVHYIYDIKNQWCMTDKVHFNLRFPKQFQRATALNVRDKHKEENQTTMGQIDNEGPSTAALAVKLTYEHQETAHRKTTFNAKRTSVSTKTAYQKTSNAKHTSMPAERSNLSALKKLALKR
jgi:hypothetical protein